MEICPGDSLGHVSVREESQAAAPEAQRGPILHANSWGARFRPLKPLAHLPGVAREHRKLWTVCTLAP